MQNRGISDQFSFKQDLTNIHPVVYNHQICPLSHSNFSSIQETDRPGLHKVPPHPRSHNLRARGIPHFPKAGNDAILNEQNRLQNQVVFHNKGRINDCRQFFRNVFCWFSTTARIYITSMYNCIITFRKRQFKLYAKQTSANKK